MTDLTNGINNILEISEKILDNSLSNVYINTGIKIFLGLYAALAAPQLPKSLVNLMDNMFIRILFAFLIVYMSSKDLGIALMIAIVFIVTLQTANKFRLYNTSLSKSIDTEVSWLPSVTNTEDNNTKEINNEAIARLSQPSENLHVIEGHVDGVESNTLNNVKKLENINDISVDKDNTCEGSWNNKNCTDISDINVPEGHDGESLATF